MHNIKTHDKHFGIRQSWHYLTTVVSELTLDNIWLNEWDIVPTRLQKNGKDTKWTILQCSDIPDLEIGQPYNGGIGNEPGTFKPITNKDFVQLVRDSISGAGHKIVSVGSVRNRGRVFISIELQGMEKFTAAGREFSSYLNFGNGHDKSSVLWVNTSNVCTVCDNTFNMNLFSVENKAATEGNDLSIRQRHTKNVTLKFPALAKLIDSAIGVQAQFQIELDNLAKIPVDNETAKNIFAGFVGRNVTDVSKGFSTRSSNIVNRLSELFRDNKQGNQGKDLSDVFSAVTDYYSHESSGGENVSRQMLSSEFGAGQVAKQDMWKGIRSDEWVEKAIERGTSLLQNTKA